MDYVGLRHGYILALPHRLKYMPPPCAEVLQLRETKVAKKAPVRSFLNRPEGF